MTTRQAKAVVLDLDLYTLALRSAEAKNSEVNYEILQQGYWSLAYSPATRDGIFVRRMNSRTPSAGYYIAYPKTTLHKRTKVSEVLEDLRTNGWPDLEGGV
jgi:hypothetical protein